MARAYVRWLEQVRGAKPATLREHRYLLAEPGTPHRRGAGTCQGLIMKSFGDRPAEEVTTRDVNAMLATLAATGLAPRTVNKSRQLVCAIYNYGCREATFGLARNPATAADRARLRAGGAIAEVREEEHADRSGLDRRADVDVRLRHRCLELCAAQGVGDLLVPELELGAELAGPARRESYLRPDCGSKRPQETATAVRLARQDDL